MSCVGGARGGGAGGCAKRGADDVDMGHEAAQRGASDTESIGGTTSEQRVRSGHAPPIVVCSMCPRAWLSRETPDVLFQKSAIQLSMCLYVVLFMADDRV